MSKASGSVLAARVSSSARASAAMSAGLRLTRSPSQVDGVDVVVVIEAPRPGHFGPVPGGDSGRWLVPDGVRSAEPNVERVVAQRWLQHRRDDLFGRGGICPQPLHSAKAADTVESRCGAGVFD